MFSKNHRGVAVRLWKTLFRKVSTAV